MKIFSDNLEIPAKEVENLNIKSEPAFYSHQDYPKNHSQYNDDSDSSENCIEPLETYYTYGRNNKKLLPRKILRQRHTTIPNQTNSNHLNQPNLSSQTALLLQRSKLVMKARKPVDRNDPITGCAICQTINL